MSRCSPDFQTIRPLAERDNANIVHWSEIDTGGHYAALEVPELVVGDLRVLQRQQGSRVILVRRSTLDAWWASRRYAAEASSTHRC